MMAIDDHSIEVTFDAPKDRAGFHGFLDVFFGIEKASDYAIMLGQNTWERERNGRE